MKQSIPIFSIEHLHGNEKFINEVFFTDTNIHVLNNRLHIPYRSSYFGLAICVSGEATLIANLEHNEIKKNSIITMSPHVIKQWTYFSHDFQTYTIFFTKSFLSTYFSNQSYIDQFGFFELNTKHVNHFLKDEIETILEILHKIKIHTIHEHSFKNEILASYINILLFEYQSMFGNLHFKNNLHQTRSQQISDEFKKLVMHNYLNERKVKFYAGLLFITPKHLSEIIKTENGKTAGEWIDEMVIMETKILLQNPSLSIGEITEVLNFTDQSAFGKFFKNITKLSPSAYRQTL